ncbi:MAG: nitrogenase-stabilizing/protective protein NifW [Gammaproteobacteria bacterium]|nr:nitrogenase-stabilizing/protective protein NifW [Gammaproteobacteria bacterium]
MSVSEFDLDLSELSSAEEFLDYFEIEYDPRVVYVNRLHILQRFHDYLEEKGEATGETDEVRRNHYATLLLQAYHDFVESSAQREKVFKVFKMNEPQVTVVPVDGMIQRL